MRGVFPQKALLDKKEWTTAQQGKNFPTIEGSKMGMASPWSGESLTSDAFVQRHAGWPAALNRRHDTAYQSPAIPLTLLPELDTLF